MTKWWTPSNSTVIRPVVWLSLDARVFLDKLIKPEFSILEFGGGGSTKWFSSKCKDVVTVEGDIDWFNALVKENLNNVVLIYGSNYPLLTKKFDVIFIDGNPIESRTHWILNSIDSIKPDGWVILDNANRPEYVGARDFIKSKAKEVVTIDKNENGTLYLVTDFYRL